MCKLSYNAYTSTKVGALAVVRLASANQQSGSMLGFDLILSLLKEHAATCVPGSYFALS